MNIAQSGIRTKNLILVSTPYHVRITAELLSNSFSSDENIIISSSSLSSDVVSLAEHVELKATGSVRVIHAKFSEKGGFPKSSTAILLFSLFLSCVGLYPSKRVRQLTGINPDRLLVFTPNAASLLMRAFYPSSEVYLCEDGLGSYTGAILERVFYLDNKAAASSQAAVTRTMLLLNRIVFSDKLFFKPKGIYLHLPELSVEYSFPTLKLAPCASCQVIKPSLDSTKWKVVYLGQAVSGSSRNHILRDDKLFELSRSIPGIIYRKHPRDSREYSDRVLDDVKDWEEWCGSIDPEHTILISDCSTASLIPKLLYGTEPLVFFLSFLCCSEDSEQISFLVDFLKKFADSYKDKSRICMPTSFDEWARKCVDLANIVSGDDYE